MREIKLEILNQKGLHARASAKFVKCAAGFLSEITLTKDDQTVNGLSIMGLLMLGAGIGSQVTIRASGQDEDEALTALSQLINDRFGEDQ
jgi:phosphocarrier protein HPr